MYRAAASSPAPSSGSFWLTSALALGPAVYAAIMYAIGDLRPEHLAIAILALILGYASSWTKSLLKDISPGILVLLGYDLMRYVRPFFVTPDRVTSCALRRIDLTLFGAGGDTTLSDYFATHHWIALDLFFAIPYSAFLPITLVYCCYLYLKDRPRLGYYLWSLALVHGIGFIFWVALPAAPPWYVRLHHCAILAHPVPSAAGLSRVDGFLGIHYFQDFYARAPDVFGALPSLHCAFPMVGLLTAWRVVGWRTLPLHVIYTVSMLGASVYLGHHWLIDGLCAWLISLVATAIVKRVRHYEPGRRIPDLVGAQ